MLSKILLIFVAFVLKDLQSQETLTPPEVLRKLAAGNQRYLNGRRSKVDISLERRIDTATNGQHPYAVVLTCSDSRAAPEHVFNAGLGDLFVIRTAGNVVSDFVLGSIEYGVEHLGAKVVIVMGHSNCGAVAATIGGGATGNIVSIVDEVHDAIGNEKNATIGENLNIAHSTAKILNSSIVHHLIEEGELLVVGAKYDVRTGAVAFDPEELTPETALDKLLYGNKVYLAARFSGNVTAIRRVDTADNGQHPYAVVLTCADSRAPAEYIFNAGIGDIFVIRTAGNVVSPIELGSIEYGVEHLGAKIVLVMGHTKCGAVAAALGTGAEGHIQDIVTEIKAAIGGETDATLAENLNVENSKAKILASGIIHHLVDQGEVTVVGAKYNIETGLVTVLAEPEDDA